MTNHTMILQQHFVNYLFAVMITYNDKAAYRMKSLFDLVYGPRWRIHNNKGCVATGELSKKLDDHIFNQEQEAGRTRRETR